VTDESAGPEFHPDGASTHAAAKIALDLTIEPETIRTMLQRFGRVHIPGVLTAEAAEAVYRSLAEETPWRRTLNSSQNKRVTLYLDAYYTRPEAWRAELEAAVHHQAALGFQYVFDNYDLATEIEAGRRHGLVCEAVYDYFNSPPFLDFLRKATGEPRIAYCDAQATRYTRGQFLNEHDDTAEGRDRLFAYVLSLTPEWKADWGGLLLFLDEDGHVAEGYTPRFNSLNLFRVPVRHCVSAVAAFCPAARYSITGWIRASGP
jgi:Rps23 Pro-64 3,4-dihydroxylase Tpa1-like proline 4-hydroxylase